MLKSEIVESIKKENGPSGRMYVEKYVKKNYFEIYEEIMKYCEKLKDLSFKEKTYHYVHDIPNKIFCIRPDCNNLTKFKNSSLGYYKYCSISCISKDQKIKDIKEKKSLENYGTKAPSMNPKIKEKMIKTNNEKYGFNSPLQNEIIKTKSKNTLFNNYGVDNPNKSEELIEKRVKSFKKSNYRENYIKTMLKRYGVENPYQVDEFLEKSKKTLLKNYGVENPYQNSEIMKKSTKNKIDTWIKKTLLKNDKILDIDYEKREYTMKCDNNKEHSFKIKFNLLKSRSQYATHLCTVCFPEYFNQTSMSEIDFISFIKDNYIGEIITNTKKIIFPYELDVYLPDLKKAFEFNGIYWHSNKYKNDDYHYNKTELCNKKNIKLTHIYDDDWLNKQDIIKSKILKEIGSDVTYNNLNIKEIKSFESIIDFIKKNSLNEINEISNNILSFGLFQGDNLMNLLVLEKNKKLYNINGFYNKNYNNIKDGHRSLFNYFIEKYDPITIESVVERDRYDDIYLELGFEIVDIIKPNFKYINKKENIGKESDKKIYDSGQLKFIYNKR